MAYASGHSRYKQYLEENEGVLTKLDLLEVFYRSSEEYNSKVATEILTSFCKYSIDFDSNDISRAMALRLELKRKKLNISYADPMGYFLSQKMRIKFLTGDPSFERLKGVEFVP